MEWGSHAPRLARPIQEIDVPLPPHRNSTAELQPGHTRCVTAQLVEMAGENALCGRLYVACNSGPGASMPGCGRPRRLRLTSAGPVT